MPIVGDAFGPPPEEEKKPKRRRTKAEVEAEKVDAAVIPGADDEVTVVIKSTGTPVKRKWSDVVDLARRGEVELSDDHALALKKQNKQEGFVDPGDLPKPKVGEVQVDEGTGEPPLTERVPIKVEETNVVWTWEQIVTHIVVNGNSNYKLANRFHGCLDAARQRLSRGVDPEAPPGGVSNRNEQAAASQDPAPGESQVTPIQDVQPVKGEGGQLMLGANGKPLIKVSMGYLEKIGLPDYSSLQIGPSAVQSFVEDTGELMEVDRSDGTKIKVRKAVFEEMQQNARDCEAVMRAERQAMINFLEQVKPGSTQA